MAGLVYAEDSLVQVAHWMRDYHQIVADFVPPLDAVWREGGTWSPGSGTTAEILEVIRARMTAHVGKIHDKAAAGDAASGRMLDQGFADAGGRAVAELVDAVRGRLLEPSIRVAVLRRRTGPPAWARRLDSLVRESGVVARFNTVGSTPP